MVLLYEKLAAEEEFTPRDIRNCITCKQGTIHYSFCRKCRREEQFVICENDPTYIIYDPKFECCDEWMGR